MECKGRSDRDTAIIEMRINSYIMECKVGGIVAINTGNVGINSYIMECKGC